MTHEHSANSVNITSADHRICSLQFEAALEVEVVMISQESTTKDVKLVGYDFRGHTRETLVVGIAYGCPYYKGSAIFSLVFFKYHK